MVHEPPPVMCTVVPLIAQLPDAAKPTARPDVAVALTPKSGSPKVLFARAPHAIAWVALPMSHGCGPSGAGSQLSPPPGAARRPRALAPVSSTTVPTLQR